MNSEIFARTTAARSVRVFDEARCASREQLAHFVDCARVTPSAGNMQVLKYRLCSDADTVKKLRPLTRWAGYIKDKKLPPDGKEPTSFIVICYDKSVGAVTPFTQMDVGIAAQTINLAAREAGFAACMIGSFDKDGVKELFGFGENIEPALIIALGTPAEAPEICSVGEDGSIKYFRDSEDRHFVPKRSLEEILL